MTERIKHARVRVVGSGPGIARRSGCRTAWSSRSASSPRRTKDAEWLSWSPEAESRGRALIELHGGSLRPLSSLRLRADESAPVESLIRVEEGDLVLASLPAHRTARVPRPRLATWSDFKAAGTRPRTRHSPAGALHARARSAGLHLSQSILITGGVGASSRGWPGPGRPLPDAPWPPGPTRSSSFPARVARGRFEADLWLWTTARSPPRPNIIRLGPWTGRNPGPDRPWLITSRSLRLPGTYDRRVSETVLLRVDEEAMAEGTVFWQGIGDASRSTPSPRPGPNPPPNRLADVVFQWVNFWGSNHIARSRAPAPDQPAQLSGCSIGQARARRAVRPDPRPRSIIPAARNSTSVPTSLSRGSHRSPPLADAGGEGSA